MSQHTHNHGKELTARQMSEEIQKLMRALGPEDFKRVFEKVLMDWIKALPEEKKKLKLLQDLYPTLPEEAQNILTRETGFTYIEVAGNA